MAGWKGRGDGQGGGQQCHPSVWAALGREAVIPARVNRTETIPHDTGKSRLREKGERLFNQLEQFRRMATGYDKLSLRQVTGSDRSPGMSPDLPQAASLLRKSAGWRADKSAATASGRWAVQLGIFSKLTNAIELRTRLLAVGRSVFIESGFTDRGGFFCVLVGPVPDRR